MEPDMTATYLLILILAAVLAAGNWIIEIYMDRHFPPEEGDDEYED